MTGMQLLTVVVAGVVTYLVRVSFLAAADRMTELPHRVTVVLRMIPPAALAALVVPALLLVREEGVPGGTFDPVSALMAGALVAAVVARWKRDIGLSLAVGLVVVVAARPLLG